MRTPLGGVDAFHLVTDRVMRSRGLAGNFCAFVVAVEGRLDLAGLGRRIERAAALLPELRRRLAWSARGPVWIDSDAAPPGIRVRSGSDETLDSEVGRLLDEPEDSGAIWTPFVIRTETHDVFAWRWFHPFTDARGAERFVAWLGSGGEAGPVNPPAPAERIETGSRPLAKLDRKARFALTKAYGDHMLAHARTPIVSLSTLANEAPHGTRVVRVRLSEEETKAFDRRVRERAKLAETSVMMFAATRVYDAILRGRRLSPAQHLVPVPLSLDPKAGAVRMFGNNLTMMTFALRREHLADLGRAVAALADQQRAIVREKLDVGMLASLDFAKAVPAGPYHWFLTRPFGGEVSSFVLSNPGAVPIASFAGMRATDAYSIPSVATPPGFQAIFTRHAGRVSASIGFAGGLLSAEEEASIAPRLRAELLGA